MAENKNVPRVRFSGFNDAWEQRKLKDVTNRITRKNKNLESKLALTISAQDGLIDQNKFFDKTIASKDVSNYYLIENGEFAYNKSYSNGYPFGAIKRLDNYKAGVLSTLYIVFELNDVNSQFMVSYFNSTFWHYQIYLNAAEGARNHGLLNISSDDFFNSKISLPNENLEQIKIGNINKKLDVTIASNQRKLDSLKSVKKSLMQKIFDQTWRLQGFTDPWEQRKLQEIAEVSTGKAFKSSKFDKYGKFEVITNKNVQDIKNNIHTQGDRINIENSDTLKAYRLSGENILVTMDGVNIGKVGKFSNNKAVLAQRVGRIKSKYINFTYQILSDDKFLNLMNKVSVGNAIKHISLQQIAEYSLFAPSDEKEILKVGSILNNVDLTIASNQFKIDKLKEIKKWLMQSMFV